MPTYEYACAACGIVEAFQSIREESLAACPQCHRPGVSRLMSGGGGVIFTGSGFWETDYNRSGDYQSKAKSEQGDSTPATEAKPKPQAQPAVAPTAAKPAAAPPPPSA